MQPVRQGAVLLEPAGSLDHVLTAPDASLEAGVADQVLQALVWPDAAVHPDPALSFRLGAGVSVSAAPRMVRFEPGGVLRLGTAYNIFSWLKWRGACDIGQLSLNLRGKGQFVVEVAAEQPEARDVLEYDATLTAGQTRAVDLTAWLADRPDSVLYLTLRAVTAGQIEAVDWCTQHPPKRRPKLLLCVTTFRREEAATATALRIDAALRGHPLADDLRLLVVDNGRSLTLPPMAHVTLVGNRNLGGAGGFARGLAEAVARGYTHCLFMDDDAWVDIASIERTWTFLAHVTDPAVAISGTLTRADEPTVVWENSAFFAGVCRSLYTDLDLLDDDALTAAEHSAAKATRPNRYGAFWYFAFPVASVQHWPFPFFVRGDDVNFSIVNPFRIVTLPGVICYQALDFADKDTSLAQYLSLRCDLLQVLLLDHMPHRYLEALRVPCAFFMRMLVLMRMDSLHTLNLAMEDVLRGPDHLAKYVDVAERRAEIASLRLRERWHAVTDPLPTEQRLVDAAVRWQRFVMKYSMNGLLLPFFGSWGNRIHLARNHRQLVRQSWGAAEITYLTPDGTQAMTLRQDKALIWREGLTMLWHITRLAFGYRRLRKEWLAGFPYLTSPAFWQAEFDKEA